jgi:hypothetical protein
MMRVITKIVERAVIMSIKKNKPDKPNAVIKLSFYHTPASSTNLLIETKACKKTWSFFAAAYLGY